MGVKKLISIVQLIPRKDQNFISTFQSINIYDHLKEYVKWRSIYHRYYVQFKFIKQSYIEKIKGTRVNKKLYNILYHRRFFTFFFFKCYVTLLTETCTSNTASNWMKILKIAIIFSKITWWIVHLLWVKSPASYIKIFKKNNTVFIYTEAYTHYIRSLKIIHLHLTIFQCSVWLFHIALRFYFTQCPLNPINTRVYKLLQLNTIKCKVDNKTNKL